MAGHPMSRDRHFLALLVVVLVPWIYGLVWALS